jgi:glutaredoxin
MSTPIVYTLTTCPACVALRKAWGEQEIEFEERLVDTNQEWMDQALKHGDAVPIIVYPDGRVEGGEFEGEFG